MTSFDLHRAATVADAVGLLGRLNDAVVMSGGTSLVLLLREGLLRPAHVVSLRDVGELRGIVPEPDGAVRIGAMTSLYDAELSPLVRQHCSALAEAFASVATVRIRHQATVGGALAHADPAQDPPVMLAALDSEVVCHGDAGEFRVPIDRFFVDVLTTVIGPREIVSGVRVPEPPRSARSVYLKFLPRTQDDYATVSVGAVAARGSDAAVTHLHVALGAAGPTVVRARAVEAALLDTRPDDRALREAAALVDEDIDPFDDSRGSAGYKREMARVWTERALRAVLM